MRTIKKSLQSITLLSVSVLLTACGSNSDYNFNKATEAAESVPPQGPVFDPAGGKIPTPNDLLMGVDGTVNIPNPADKDGKVNPLIAAINELDGASTSNPMIVQFGFELNKESLKIGDTIRVFEVTKAGLAVTGVKAEVTSILIKVLDDKKTLALVPFPPFKENTSYLVALTNDIKDVKGNSAQAPSAYSLARSNVTLVGSDFEKLEPVRQHIGNLELIAKSQGVDTNKIILSWAFSTQSITAVLKDVAANAEAGKIVMAQTPFNTALLKPAINYGGLAFTGAADVHIGTLDIPYYLDKAKPLTGYWKNSDDKSPNRNNVKPIATSTLTVPVMMTTPSASLQLTKPAEGWPIVIYQHGITRYRTDMLIYADSLAKKGFAVIAMDLPLHGVPKTTRAGTPNPFHASATAFPTDVEPSFELDLIDNATGAPAPSGDGKIDSSGAHFINLQSLLTSRDNNRQGVSNLLVLRRSLKDIADIDETYVGFIAHSLGGVVGVPYLGVENTYTPSALITTGASITTIIRDSASYGPTVKGALAAAGVTGAAYDQFLQGAQWVLDSSDPINFTTPAVSHHAIYMTEIIGDGGTHLSDTTVPNSSTEILAALIGAKPATLAENVVAVGAPKIIRFTQGDHSSILDPSDDVPTGVESYLNVFEEMHAQVASFMESSGTKVEVSDDLIIKQ